MKNKCIFHYPAPIVLEGGVGSEIRPAKIYKALKREFDVDIVSGYGKERKEKINKIKENIKNGVKYDFLYSESLTQPMLLSEKNHIPKYPLLDFNFFKYCKKQNIKIGLFYRDFYWKFPIYAKNTKKWVPFVTIPFYKYELKMYEKLLDIFYLPSLLCTKYINLKVDTKALPPGNVIKIKKEHNKMEKGINLFYVGGVSDLYDITGLVKVVSEIEAVKLTICCPIQDWEKNKGMYEPYLNENITVVHKRGNELETYYNEADIACLYFMNNEYRDLAMPIKLFEYIGHGKPIISNSKTSAAELIESNDIGWIVDYDDKNLNQLLNMILANNDVINQKAENVKKVAFENTWEKRAAQIAKDLVKI